jgi:CRP/FNR family cyclic AMP-dependent transcriptional regulator
METLDQLIAATGVFAGTRPDHLKVVAGCARNAHVEADRYLLREGDPADTFFLIRRGSVALEVHSPLRGALVIETLAAGDAVGWSWLFEPYSWQLDARTIEPCSLVAIDGACLRGKCEADHELGYELMGRFASELIDRLQATRLQLLDVYGDARIPG